MYSNSDAEIKKLDVYIHPDIYGYSVVDFDKKNEILEKGTIEAKKYVKIFREIAAKQKKKKKRKKIDHMQKKVVISAIDLDGSENYTRAYVLGKLKIRVGDSLYRTDISRKIHLLQATRNYNRITYDLVKKKDNSYLLHFVLKESNENSNIQLGVHYDQLYKSSALITYNHKHLLKENDLFSMDMILGDNFRYNLHYFVDNGFYISYGFKSRYNDFKTQIPLKESSNSYSLRYTDFTNQLFLQTTFNRKFAIGVGTELKKIKASSDNLPKEENQNIFDNSTYFNAFGYIKLDAYNKKYFPTKGFYANLGFKWYLWSTDFSNDFKSFPQAKGTLGFVTSFWDNFSLKYTASAGFSLDQVKSTIFDFYLGGYNQNNINNFMPMYGYKFAELSEASFVKSEFNLYYQFYPKNYFSFIANYASLEDNVFKDIDLFKDVKSGYAVGYSYNSIIGPIELKYSWSPDNNRNFWLFNIGFWF
ncbi:MAG: patatin-like phospholipase family protein, partial [Polaribacter sp.]